MHKFIFQNRYFPHDVLRAIREGCHIAEMEFNKIALNTRPIDKSGSCATVCLIIDNTIYTINVGDSRAFVSENRGSRSL